MTHWQCWWSGDSFGAFSRPDHLCGLSIRPAITTTTWYTSPADSRGYDIDEAEVIYWGQCPECRKNVKHD